MPEKTKQITDSDLKREMLKAVFKATKSTSLVRSCKLAFEGKSDALL